MKDQSFSKFALVIAVALSALLSACGKKSNQENSGGVTENAAARPSVVISEGPIVIQGDDTMRFDKTSFAVKSGQSVEIVFKNVGKMPKQAMGHNLVILAPATDVNSFAMAAISHKDNDYIPRDPALLSQIVAYTKILGPGEEDILTFTAGAPGDYPYICSFPGHAGIMRGVMTVVAP